MKIHGELITSRTNPFVKWAASLQSGKGRDGAKSFIAEGEKLCFEAIEAKLPVSHVIISESQREKMLPRVKLSLENDCFPIPKW